MSNTSQSKRCTTCGEPIPAEAPQGLCPKCLLEQVSFATDHERAGSKSPAPAHEALAAAFPQLEILELIGQGGMGFVFKARQPKLDRFVALKILPEALAADPAFAERIAREGRVLARLSHPNIVTIHDFGQAGGFFYLLMEFVDGVNLRQAMKVGRFTPAQALSIVPSICEALQFAHNEGILHRDIKPENILLDSKGRVKIADFGIAKLVGRDLGSMGTSPGNPAGSPPKPEQTNLTEAGKVLGTPHYMAPEQRDHPQQADERADIYSLGVVFYEMLTGELPVGRFALPSEKSTVDPRIDQVVLRTLEKERERRTQSADEVKTQVESIVKTSKSGERARPDAANPPKKPRQDWWTWSPLQSPEVGEICAHLTKAERNYMSLLGLLISVWVVGTSFGIPAFLRFNSGEGKWIVTVVWIVLFVVSIRMFQRFIRHFLTSTTWAREQGIKPEQLRLFAFNWSNLLKAAAVLGAGLIIIFSQHKAISSYLGLSKSSPHVEAKAIPPTHPTPAAEPAFGPVVERRINLASTGTNFLLSFKTGATQSPPPNATNSSSTLFQWSQRNDVDCAAGLIGNLVLTGFEMAAVPAPGQCWEELTPRQAVQRLDSLSLESFKILSYGTEALPYTCAFRTGRGEIGLLQVTRQVSEPPGLEIRYKLAKSIPATSSGEAKSNSTAAWSPTLWPGEKADPDKVLEEARALTRDGHYPEALKRFLWYHNHALEFDKDLRGVRLSFALSDWVELGRRYPGARQALMEIRDQDLGQFQEGRGYGELFQEIAALNQALNDEDATYKLFKMLVQKDEPLARQCYFYAETLLVSKGEYDLCYEFMGNPQERFNLIQQNFAREGDMRKRMEEMRQKTTQHVAAMNQKGGWTNSWSPPDTTAMMKKSAEDRFVGQARMLIEILVATGHKTEAEKIRADAIQTLDDLRLLSSVEDAEKRIHQ